MIRRMRGRDLESGTGKCVYIFAERGGSGFPFHALIVPTFLLNDSFSHPCVCVTDCVCPCVHCMSLPLITGP